MIGDCGELAPGEDDGVVEDSSDPYPTFPVDAPHIDFKDVSTKYKLNCVAQKHPHYM